MRSLRHASKVSLSIEFQSLGFDTFSVRLPAINIPTKRKLLLLWGGVLVILIGTVIGNLKAIGYYRDTERTNLTTQSVVVGNALAAHSRQIMRQVDTILRGVQIFYSRSQSIPDSQRYIAGLTVDEGLFSGIFIADRGGRVSLIQDKTAEGFSVDDRSYFRLHQADPSSGMIISPVVAGRATNAFNFHVSRRLDNADGSFAGVVIATVNPDVFVDYMRDLSNRPAAATIALYGTSDHKLRFRIPVPSALQWDKPVDSPIWGLLPHGNSGHFAGISPIDGVARSLYFKKVADYPLVAMSGFSESSLAAMAFDRGRWLLFGSAALASFILLLATSASLAITRGTRLGNAKAELESLYREMERLAMTDSLTGLPGRTMFMDRLAQAIALARREHTFVGVLFLDLDGFKPINDQFGHKAGDWVLKTIAHRWEACLREVDTVARLGGDEFAVVLGGLEVPDDVIPLAEKLISAAQVPIQLPDGQQCLVGASVGVSVYPKNAVQIDSLLTMADDAMYKSKATGKNRLSVSDAFPAEQCEWDDWLTFDDSMCVGNDVIDEQHRHLSKMVNHFSQSIKDGANAAILEELFDEIIKFATYNSETEDSLMLADGYPQQAKHHNEHTRLTIDLTRAKTKFGKGGEYLAMQKIREWLIIHLQSDRELGHFLNSLHP